MKCPTHQESQLILSTALQQSLNFIARLLAPQLTGGIRDSEEAFNLSLNSHPLLLASSGTYLRQSSWFSCQCTSKWYEKEVTPKNLTTQAIAAQALSPSLL